MVQKLTRRCVLSGAGALGVATLLSPAEAKPLPSNLMLVVPFAAGGSADIMARIVGRRLAELLKVNVVIDNRGGAGGNLAASHVAKSQPDGSTLLWGTISTHALNPLMSKTVPYDPVKDFTPISALVTLPNVMLVNPQVPARTVAEMIALLKANPEQYSFASSGMGTPLHLSGELFKLLSETQMRHVPYRGSGPALNDVVAGHVPVMFDTLASATQHIRSGSVRALAVTTRQRSSAMPDFPTLEEAGLQGYETYAWHALFGPPGMAAETVGLLNDGVQRTLESPDVSARLQELGATVQGSSAADLGALVRSELAKWAPIVKAAGIAAE